MKRVLAIVAGILVLTLAAVGVLLFTPVSDPNLSSHPKPARSYDDAVARITSDQNADAAMPLQPGGASIAMLTGQRSDTAVVLFHGLTVVPEQFRLIGEAYRAQGYNVWIPRLPHHGLADRLTDELSTVTAQDVRNFADHSIDIAAGLGTKVIVVGTSGGGAVGLWAAAERPPQLTVVRIPASLALGHDIVGFQRSNSSYPRLTEAYHYLAEALGIPLADPKAAS